MTKAKRKSAAELVGESLGYSTSRTWFELLPPKDQQYVREVVAEARERPDIPLYCIAESLIVELRIKRGKTTVYRTLKEMVKNAA